MDMATGGDSSSTVMLAMISAVFGEIFTASARSSFGSCVDVHSVTPCRESPMTSGETWKLVPVDYYACALTYFSVQASTGPLIRFLVSIHQALLILPRCFRER